MPPDNEKCVIHMLVPMNLHPFAATQSLASSFVLYRSTVNCNTTATTNSTPNQGEDIRGLRLLQIKS